MKKMLDQTGGQRGGGRAVGSWGGGWVPPRWGAGGWGGWKASHSSQNAAAQLPRSARDQNAVVMINGSKRSSQNAVLKMEW
jgi:hypothetical protein